MSRILWADYRHMVRNNLYSVYGEAKTRKQLCDMMGSAKSPTAIAVMEQLAEEKEITRFTTGEGRTLKIFYFMTEKQETNAEETYGNWKPPQMG